MIEPTCDGLSDRDLDSPAHNPGPKPVDRRACRTADDRAGRDVRAGRPKRTKVGMRWARSDPDGDSIGTQLARVLPRWCAQVTIR